MREKAIVSWSGGKDSALALYEMQKDCEIVALLTTVTQGYDRISVHGVRTSLLERQARSLGLALEKVIISPTCSNEEYEIKMRTALEKYRQAGVTSVICGDIFLEDVRRYREEKLFTVGLKGVFPLWKRDTTELAHRFLALGFQAILCCVDTSVLDQEFAGRLYDPEMLARLPPGVDACGENGEFHSFVFGSPNMATGVKYGVGERILRDNRYCYCDLLPGDE
jgi:uncharacterized protein (TIGR00290 family)